MTSVPSVEQAVSASIACAEALGIEVRGSRVIAAGYSVRVLLEPARIVTRVMTEGQVLRGDPLPWLQREVAVASYLEGCPAELPVLVGPLTDIGTALRCSDDRALHAAAAVPAGSIVGCCSAVDSFAGSRSSQRC